MSAFSTRIFKETRDLVENPIEGTKVNLDPNNNRHFYVHMSGPLDSPYAGGWFTLEVSLPPGYPMKPPRVRFLTKIYHLNVDELGRVYMPEWNPITRLRALLIHIQELLRTPNILHPYHQHIAELWLNDPDQVIQMAKQFTLSHASDGVANGHSTKP